MKQLSIGKADDALTARLLEEAVARFQSGFREQALAVLEIVEKELFRSAGYDNFIEFAKARLDVRKSGAYRLLEAAQFFQKALEQNSPIGEKVTNLEQIRGLSGMRPENKLKVVAKALQIAEQIKKPLSGSLVESVARQSFGWKSRAEYGLEKAARKARERSKDEVRSKQRADLELAFSVILGLRLSGYELQAEFGNLEIVVGGLDVLQALNDWRDSGV